MPNYVQNWLTIYGPTEEVQRVTEAIRSDYGALDFNKIIPYPDRFKEMDEIRQKFMEEHKEDEDAWSKAPRDGFNNGGYEWCCENWGTKWNACCINATPIDERYQGTSVAHVLFETAWSPPEPVFKKMAEMFPLVDLTLNFFEQGCAFCGELHSYRLAYRADESVQAVTKWNEEYTGHRGG